MGMPSRSLKLAIDLRLSVTSGFWPVICFIASTASSMYFFSPMALPTPMLTTIFCKRGNESRLRAAELLGQARAESPCRTSPATAGWG